jgi:hypothetical protein
MECSWAPSSFALWTVASHCALVFVFFDAMVELHAMDEKKFNDFLIRKWPWILHTCNKVIFNS